MNPSHDHRVGQWMEFPAAGQSMGRHWRHASRLLGELVPVAPVRWADVIIYEIHGRSIAHRVVRIYIRYGQRFLVTKGDGSLFPDRLPVRVDEVRAVVRAVTINQRLQLVDQGLFRGLNRIHAMWGWCLSWIWRPLMSAEGNRPVAE